MPVQEQTPFNEHTGNGVTTVFAYQFQVLAEGDLAVFVDGAQKSNGSDYTIAGVGNEGGGQITFVTAPAVGADILLARQMVLARDTDYQTNGDLREAVLDRDFNRIWLVLQGMSSNLDTAIRLPFPEIANPLPGVDARKNRLMSFDDQGQPSTALPISDSAQDVRIDLAKPSGASMVGFQQPEAGSVPRTVQDKLADIEARIDYDSDAAFEAAAAASTFPNIDGAGNLSATVVGTGGAVFPLSAIGDAAKISLRPAVLEQHFTGFYGRGMLTAEVINVVTETTVATAAAGASSIVFGNASQVIAGGCVTLRHDNGRYATYFVLNKVSNTLDISPKLKWACTLGTARGERTWFNRAHPGKFYMRELAQRIASANEFETAISHGDRLMYLNFTTDTKYTLENTLSPTLGAVSIIKFDASNTGVQTYAPVRFGPGRTAYTEGLTAVDDGWQTQLFETHGAAQVVVRILFGAFGSNSFKIRVLNEKTDLLCQLSIPGGADQLVMREYRLMFDARSSKKFKVQVMVDVFASTSGYFTVGYIDAFKAQNLNGPVITNKSARIVCLGDSWIAGDEGNTPERESIVTQLRKELPYADIINSGVGGNTVFNLLSRFNTDVKPYKPDYVVVCTGTNDAYNPSSGTFDPTAIQGFLRAYTELLSRIVAIGARPIVIGVPALAQSDAEVPALPEWTLNDRAKAYQREWLVWEGGIPVISIGSNSNGVFIRYADGRLECFTELVIATSAANTLAIQPWTFPSAFVTGSKPNVQATLSNSTSGQLVGTGTNAASPTAVQVTAISGTSALSCSVAVIAKGFWRDV